MSSRSALQSIYVKEERAIEAEFVSIVVPTLNGERRIGACLHALSRQVTGREFEIVVVDDGSTDGTATEAKRFSGVRLIREANAGPAAARNRGAREARGSILLFTDDDCIPMPNWMDAMLAPFSDPEVVGAKGVYRTRQSSVIARFVQIEYEDKYRLTARERDIDFVDTYSAGFRRDSFLQIGGYDTSFPVACAEDVELSYRMAARGWKMKFVPDAIVYHTHPDQLGSYLRKKYKFAYWRMLAVRKNPGKGIKDSHTPQIMKLQLLLAPALICAAAFDLNARREIPATAFVLAMFLFSTLPFAGRALRKDIPVGLLSPFLLGLRACAQFLGATRGAINAWRSIGVAERRKAA